MRRRLFIQSGSAAAVTLALAGCGGGGGGGAGADAGNSSALANSTRSGDGYPFGARIDSYVAGILPNQSKSAMDAVLTKQYDAWKAANVVAADSIVAGGYAVQFSNRQYLAVSEGLGYGMLLTVLFAGHDPEARKYFDGMLAVVRARWAYGNGEKALMDWRINADGSSGGEGWNAMDGDLDIAMALLMADRQWGSGGSWNYLSEGIATVNAIKAQNMKPNGTTMGLSTANVSRTSDYMIGHFRAFKKATGDAFWDTAVDRSYELLDHMQTAYSAVGLMPDFIVNTDANPIPSPGMMGDGNYDENKYWWNACRNPWRFSSDYVLSGDARFAKVTGKMIDFFQSASGGDPARIGTGYSLDGAKLAEYTDPSFNAPICAGACVDARFQSFADALWDWNVNHLTTGYYASEIQLLSMAVASGNWWTP
jgi:hypothetical protein